MLKVQRNILLITLLISLLGHYILGLENMMQSKAYEYQIERQAMQIKDKQEQIELLEVMLEHEEEVQKEIEDEYLGTFTVTHYCLENYPHICNDGESLYTASGQAPIPYYTIAADESIEFGTKLIIDGKEYEVMDRGGMITEGRLDLAVETHDEALKKGIVQADVYKGGINVRDK